MQLSPSIVFRGIRPSPTLEADIVERIEKLETYYRPIMGCRVLVEVSRRHHKTGNRCHVRIDLTVPGEEIVVAHEASLHATAKDAGRAKTTKQDEPNPERRRALVVIREAFVRARRRLQDVARRQRGAVKTHRVGARPARGRIPASS